MASFLEGVAAGVKGVQCQLLRANEYVLGSLGRFGGPTRDRALDGLNAIGVLLGCPGGSVPPPPPPFAGGQCPVVYRARFSEVGTSFTTEIPPGGLLGPILSATATNIGPGPAGTTTYRLEMCSAASGCIANNVNTFSPSPGFIPTPFREDGLPDNCGELPGEFPPPTNINIDIDIDYDDDDGNPINITIPFVFAPVEINFNGDIRIPFNFDFGGFEFSGDINFLPDASVTINPPGGGTGGGVDLDPVGEGPPSDDVDPEEGSEKIIGVVVSSTANALSNITDILTIGMPRIFAPRLGSIKFAYSIGAATFWSNDIDIKGERVFIPCPFSQGADAAVASPVPGVSLSFVEVRGFPLATTSDISRTA